MPPSYRIHPGIGIARLGDSPTGFCISPETPAALPTACDDNGNPLLSADGTTEVKVAAFKDAEGRIKRQAARFQVYVYDEEAPDGRPLRLGDPVEGGGNDGVLVDIQWRVHLANKKAVWYQFRQLEGEHGYAPDHPRRNAGIAGREARQQLIIDPGPQIVDRTTRRASFGRDRNDDYAATFPPANLKPHSVETLGDLLTDDAGRLLVLGGHGRSGSFLTGFGQPRIDDYANNDGWFDDTSDGPVMARLVMYSREVGALRFVDVEYPAWVLVGYPRYVPEILDMITLDDVILDMSIRNFAYRTDLYGTAGTFADPQRLDPEDTGALLHWKAGRLVWNAAYKPWFWRDVWPILFRADEMTYLTNVLEASNYPHNQSERGSFDPFRLCVPPRTVPTLATRLHEEAAQRSASGDLLLEAARSALELLDQTETQGAADALEAIGPRLRDAAASFSTSGCPRRADEDPAAWLDRWKETHASHQTRTPGAPDDDYDLAARAFEDTVAGLIREIERGPEIGVRPLSAAFAERRRRPSDPRSGAASDEPAVEALKRCTRDFRSGRLLQKAIEAATLRSTRDQYRDYRRYLYDLLRQSGEENVFQLGGRPDTRISNLPLMPLLAGDNPISNVVPSKFLRLTDYQLFVLRQWADGLFHDEVAEGWVAPPDAHPFDPTAGWVNRTARDLDRGVLTNLLGGAFCPGGEVGWIIRNPAIWKEPYRLKADPTFYTFQQTAAQASAAAAPGTAWGYASYTSAVLSQDSDYAAGLQPGDLTKMSSLPWQSDFNECSTQDINVTYEYWNRLDPASVNDTLLEREERVWQTLWWPAHRPLQVLEVAGVANGTPSYRFVNWTPGVPQTLAGDFKMTTEWSKLGFVVRNPYISRKEGETPSAVGPAPKYVCIERDGSE